MSDLQTKIKVTLSLQAAQILIYPMPFLRSLNSGLTLLLATALNCNGLQQFASKCVTRLRFYNALHL